MSDCAKRWISAGQIATSRCFGYTLIELMVAITIGLIILAAVSQLFVTNRSAYRLEEALARIQESGRFALDFLSADLRMAGYAGCSNSLTASSPDPAGNCADGTVCSIVTPPVADGTQFDPAGIRAYAYTGSDWSPSLPPTFFDAGEVRPGTDVVIVQYQSPDGAQLVDGPFPTNSNLKVSTSAAQFINSVEKDDILIVSDCISASVFRVTNALNSSAATQDITHSNAGNSNNRLPHLFGPSATVSKLITRAYYISNGTGGEPAFFRRDIDGDSMKGITRETVELVEGVETLKLLFGVDSNGDNLIDTFRPANDVIDWRSVKTARIGLVLRTPHNVDIANDTTSYNVFNASTGNNFYTPTEQLQRRRRIFTSSVQLRNH